MKRFFNELFVVGMFLGVILGANGLYYFVSDSGLGQVLGTSSSNLGLLLAEIYANEEVCTTPDSLDVLVSKRHAIDPDYVPDDLVELSEAGVRTVSGGVLRSEVAQQMSTMFQAMDDAGVRSVYVLSSFRSFQHQDGLKKSWLQRLGMQAERLSADAGHSEHQLGTTSDLSFAGGASLDVGSDAWQWLTDHGHEYGFVMTYREDNTEFTGYDFEPWHWRYVGIGLATRIHNEGGRPEQYYLTVGCRSRALTS